MESSRKAALAGAALLGVFIAAYAARSGGDGDSGPSGPQAVDESARPARPRPASNSNTNTNKNTKGTQKGASAKEPGAPGLPERAHSLRGTDIDGALRVGPDGKLELGPDVVRFFEYFLSATGEESDAVIRARIEAAIREKLDGPAEAEALALLDKYMAYREAGRNIAVPPGADEDPLVRLNAVKKLRRTHFGEEAASLLFGDEELEGEVAAERARIMKDPALSPEERQAKLAEVEAKLPEAARNAGEAATRPLRLREGEAALRANGASEEEVHRHRVEAVGEEAADRLRELDRSRAEWKGRIEAFRAERDRIAKQYGDEGARKAAEAKLFEESFRPEERARAKAVVNLPRE
jgi:lipase chaperone LimK